MITTTLEDVIKTGIGARLDSMCVCRPARVVTYDPVRQEATVQPLIRTREVTEDGDETTALEAPIQGVPVVFPGSGACSYTFPVTPGDYVLLLFGDQALDKWLLNGGDVDPEDGRRFDVNDAIAIPGLRPRPNRLASNAVASSATVITDPSEVRLGDATATGPTASVVVQQALLDFMAALAAAIPGAGVAGAALTSLKGQLDLLNSGQGWLARTSKTKAK